MKSQPLIHTITITIIVTISQSKYLALRTSALLISVTGSVFSTDRLFCIVFQEAYATAPIFITYSFVEVSIALSLGSFLIIIHYTLTIYSSSISQSGNPGKRAEETKQFSILALRIKTLG